MMRGLLILWALLAAAPAVAVPAMWVIRSAGAGHSGGAAAETEITLFGTVHALPGGTSWMTPAIAAQLAGADTLVLEAVLPDDPSSLAPEIARLGVMPGLAPLATRVAPALRDRITALAAGAVPMAGLDRMATWLASITLTQISMASIGVTATDGVEPELTMMARATAKPVVGLETVEQQLGYLAGLPEADQVAMLEATLMEVGDLRTETDRLIGLWRAGDVETISREFFKDARASPRLERVLLADRNRRWVAWLATRLHQPGKVFVGVGVGHFGGPTGLLALLAAKGIAVQKIE